MIVSPHCERPWTSVGIGSVGLRSIPTILPQSASPHWAIATTPWPFAVDQLPRGRWLSICVADAGEADRKHSRATERGKRSDVSGHRSEIRLFMHGPIWFENDKSVTPFHVKRLLHRLSESSPWAMRRFAAVRSRTSPGSTSRPICPDAASGRLVDARAEARVGMEVTANAGHRYLSRRADHAGKLEAAPRDVRIRLRSAASGPASYTFGRR